MSSGLDRSFLEELIGRSDIIRVVSRYVTLTKKGNSHWGCCPFHHEKTPSFSVSEAKQFYKCFGCGEGGDVIKFLMKIESLSFMDAVKALAADAGMQVPEFQRTEISEELKSKREEMIKIHTAAAKFYYAQLQTEKGRVAREYLDSRKIPNDIRVRFGLGYSPGYTELPSQLRREGLDLDIACECGVLGKKTDERFGNISDKPYYYDFFGGRLMFPIIDSIGNVIAFGGRILEKKDDVAKYKNTSATLIWDKSKNIYGINLIKKKRLKQNVDYLILCEGYVDVISLHQAGFDTAVASMGTALTVEQCRLISRFAGKKIVYVSYDGDAAGQHATMRGLDMLVEEGLTVKVIRLPSGLDPDDLIKRDGAEGYQECIDTALPYFEYKLNMLALEYDQKSNDGRTKFATAASVEIGKLDNKFEREIYMNQLTAMTGFSLESVKQMVVSPVEDDVKRTLVATASGDDKAANHVLYCFVMRDSFVDNSFDLSYSLASANLRDLYSAFVADTKLSVATAFSQLDERLCHTLEMLLEHGQSLDIDENVKKADYFDCLRKLKVKRLSDEINSLSIEFGVAPPIRRREIMESLGQLQEDFRKLQNI